MRNDLLISNRGQNAFSQELTKDMKKFDRISLLLQLQILRWIFQLLDNELEDIMKHCNFLRGKIEVAEFLLVQVNLHVAF